MPARIERIPSRSTRLNRETKILGILVLVVVLGVILASTIVNRISG